MRQELKRRPGGAGLVLLGAILGCATLLFVLLFKLPSVGAIERSAEVASSVAELALLPPTPDAASRRALATTRVDSSLRELRRALSQDALTPSQLAEVEALWARARLDDSGAAARLLVPLASSMTADVRSALDARNRRLEFWIKALALALACMLIAPLYLVVSQRKRVRESLSQFSDDLSSGHWQDAVRALRNDAQGPPSAFDALATGVAGVMADSDRRWQALADLSADWYWETDHRHQITRLFGSVAVFTSQGWKVEDLLGQRHDQLGFLRAANRDGWNGLHQLFERGEPFRDFEFNVISRDRRTMRWLTVSGRPRVNNEGHCVGYEGVGRDVTDRKRALSQLQASEQRWAAMVRLASDWYWQTDAQHQVMPLAAENEQRVLEFAEQVVGKTLWDAFPKAMSAEGWELQRIEMDAQRPFRGVELIIDSEDGQRRWLSFSGIPRKDSQGRFRGYHGVGRNITGHKEAERVLLRHNEELQRAVGVRTLELESINSDLEAFARQLAHELRTPIGHVQGLAHLLQARAATRLDDEDRQLLTLQVQAAVSMRDTVDALLTLARSTMQVMPLEPLDVSSLVREVIDALPPLSRTAPVRWTVQPGLTAMASPGALKIVLTNLLGNAAKFTRRRSEPQVQVSGQLGADGRMHLAVDDNGVGFEPDQAERLFTPFGRLHTGEDYHGTGIGLTIVQRIVERHGGKVKAQGRKDHGARFELSLMACDELPLTAASSAPGAAPATPSAAVGTVAPITPAAPDDTGANAGAAVSTAAAAANGASLPA